MRVLHFIRKSTQLKASFIKNQIKHHLEYEPLIVFRLNPSAQFNGGFGDLELGQLKYLDLSGGETLWEKLIFRLFRRISIRQAKLIDKFINTHHIDVLHFHYGSDAGIYTTFLKQNKLPAVVSFYGYDCSGFPRFYWGYGKYYLRHRVFPSVTRVFAMSEDMKIDLLSLGCTANKIVVHYYGTDINLFKDLDKEYVQKNDITLLILAGLVPQKGHFFLLKAIQQVIQRNIARFNLRIVGVGPLQPALEKYVRENELKDFVRFIGAVRYASPEMLKEFIGADIFVHPSVTDTNGDKEGIPGSVIEAMASGLPVISTFHAGIPSVIENEKTGLLVKEWDVTALAVAIERLIKDVALRRALGCAARDFAGRHLDLLDKEKELEAIYNQLVN